MAWATVRSAEDLEHERLRLGVPDGSVLDPPQARRLFRLLAALERLGGHTCRIDLREA
jgi:hypothetical protein